MNAGNLQKWMRKFVGVMGIVGVSVSLGWPALADYYYPGPSYFNPSASYPTRGTLLRLLAALNYNQFATALEQVPELEQILNQEGPFTIFLPTDEAFNALPAETVANLLKPENNKQLTELLLYHITPDQVTQEELETGQVKTLEGKPVQLKVVEVDGGNQQLLLNEAKLAEDSFYLKNANGETLTFVVIDQVLMPSETPESADSDSNVEPRNSPPDVTEPSGVR